ncbi:phospholipase B1, membrane-associated isoform X2 [Lepisosteus oculatus]|uniref:phospholipase B1, membrane-associated isoform X2 n=1 Tax=Lepisosteus oculatus TaxID=7918 RepID=UPI0035F5073F
MDPTHCAVLVVLVSLLGHLPALTGSLPQSGLQLIRRLADQVSAEGEERTDTHLGVPCPHTLSWPSPSSVHSLRPSDITTLAAIGLQPPVLSWHPWDVTDRAGLSGVLDRLAELLALFNPDLSTLQPDNTQQPPSQSRALLDQAEDLALSLQSSEAMDSSRDWRLILVFGRVEVCSCDDQVGPVVQAAVQQVADALQVLHRQVPRALVTVVPWTGQYPFGHHGQDQRLCRGCDSGHSAAEIRLQEAVLSKALQEALEHHLLENNWYSDREDFTVVLQPPPAASGPSHTLGRKDPPVGHSAPLLDSLVLQLWMSLLQPATEDNDISPVQCPSEDRPYLRTHRNTHSEREQLMLQGSRTVTPTALTGGYTSTPTPTVTRTPTPKPLDPVMGSELLCSDRRPSDTSPSSVHSLRPGDVRVVAAVGDSLTAGNGVGAAPNNLLDVLKQYRGLSWSIGGEETLNTVTTLPNILRNFSHSLTGFSVGTGDASSPSAFFNQAVPGANSDDMPAQVRTLVDMMKRDTRIEFQSDWKVITMFVGGNDLCDFCTDSVYFSAVNFKARLQQALDILHKEVPRVFVNLVEPLYIIPLRKLHQDTSLGCPTSLVKLLCRCVLSPKEGSRELQTLIDTNRAYQRAAQELVDSGRYDARDDFTVVLQPFFRQLELPLLEDGRPDRAFFTPDCFHLSQRTHAIMARALWNNMLEPLGSKTSSQNFSTSVVLHCPSQTVPFLRTYQNSNYTYPGPPPTQPPIKNWGSDLACTGLAPSDSVPTSVHRLRPGDVKVVAALGDSLSAGFGAKATSILNLRTEWRGRSWSIGGDESLEKVTTLPNILRKFSSSLYGFSLGRGTANSRFNMAVSGAKAVDIPQQVQKLIQAMKDSKEVDFPNDWKMVTLFIGGNDLCQYCLDRETLSVQNYTRHLRDSLDLLYREVPRVFVNLLEILQIEGLRRIRSDTLGCSLLQRNSCPCFLIPGENSLELTEIKRINQEYQEETERLVSGGRYDGREDFAVVTQPFLKNSIIPLAADGEPDLSFFSVDCFHFSERGHAEMAIGLWNNMLEPVGRKQNFNNFTHDRNKIRCPSQDQPYFFTRINSFPIQPTTPPATSTPPTLPLQPVSTVPLWAPIVTALGGLLIGWAATWLLLSRRVRQRLGEKEKKLEMKGTSF